MTFVFKSKKSKNELYELIMDKLKSDNSRFTNFEVAQIDKILIEHVIFGFQPIAIQIHRDIKAKYKKYDAMAMWIDGLFRYEENAMREIIRVVGGIS